MSAQDTLIDDGGPAFPETGMGPLANGEFHHGRSGMSLRDYLATHASEHDVQCALEDLGRTGGLYTARTGIERNAIARYAHADAMLKVRAAS